MKLTEDVANAGFVLNGADDELTQKRKNTVSLPSDVMNINGPERTQLGDVAERNRQAAKQGVSVQSQVGGKTLRDEALARKAAKSASGHGDKGWTARGGVHGGTGKETPYGAVRDDFLSPATQGDLNAVLTDDPADVHTGGIVSPGRRIYGDLPEEDSAFYIKQKFDEVEPYPLVMPDGKEYMTNTSNLRKAEWQYWANIVEAPSLNWAGYYNLGEKPSEPWVQTAVRGAINLFPMLLVRSGQQVANVSNFLQWGFEALKEDPRATERYYERQKLITDTVHDYLDASQLYFSDASEEGANKYAYIVGQTLGSVGIASLGTKAAVLALSLGEGLSDAAVTQQATAEMGMSPTASFLSGIGAGTVSGALSFLPEWVYPNAVDDLAKKTGKTLLRMAVRSPGDITSTVAERGWKRVILEGLTEVGQEVSTDVFSSGFDSDNLEMRWDEKAAILIASLVMGGAGTYHQISKAKKFEDGLRDFDTRMREMQKQFMPAFVKIIEESKGMFTEQQLDQILTVIKNPDFARQMTNIIRGAVIANFDKFTPEQMKSMLDKIKGWKPDAMMFKEFSILEQKMDDLLRDSDLTAAQKERFRMYMRGTAAWQVVHMGRKPSEVRLPLRVSNVPPKGVPSAAAGNTTNNGIIYVTTRNASEPVTSLYGVAPEVNTTNKKAKKSANMAGIMANANMENADTTQTVGEAFMTHEMTHWIKDQTGLKNVDAYMSALKNVVDTMVPGLIESYTKQPSRGGNKAEKKAAKKNRNSVDLAEAYAYAMQYAGLQAKEIFGVEGEVADAMTFLNMMLKASAITSKLSPELKKLYDFFEDTMKANKEAMKYLLAEIPSEQLRGAIKSFVETGDPSYLTVDGIRALDAALNSIVDAETSDILGQALPSRVEVVDFMNAVNTYYSDKAKAEREAERAARDEAIKEADAIVGIAEEEAPVINTVEDAVVEGVMDVADSSNTESEPKSTLDQKIAEGKTTLKTVGLDPIEFQTDSPKVTQAQKSLLSAAQMFGFVDDDMTPEQFVSLSIEEQKRLAKKVEDAWKVEQAEIENYMTGDRPGYEPGEAVSYFKDGADHQVFDEELDSELREGARQKPAQKASSPKDMRAVKTLLSAAKALDIVSDDMTPEQFASLSSEEQARIARETDAAIAVEMAEVESYNTGDRPGYEPEQKASSPKVAADQDVKGWVDSESTTPAAENRTGATKNIEEMSEQKLLEWRVHIPEIIRTELTASVDDDLELVWSDSSDEKPFKFSSAVRKDPKKRAQLHARLKQYYKTIVSEVNRRIESGEMSESGEQFISKNGLFAVWNPNMLWSDDYLTHLANKIAGRIEGQVATDAEKQLYRAIREYEKNVAFLYDGYVTDYLTVPRVEPYQRSFPGMGYKEYMSNDVRSSTGNLVGMDDISSISEDSVERVYSAIDYLQDLEEALSAISVSDDPKVLGFLYGLNEQNARRIAYKEISNQYAKATKRLSMRDLTNKNYYKSRNIWLQEGLLKRIQNRINYLSTKLNEDMYRDDFGTELRDIEISDEIKAGVSAKRAKAVREELGALKKAFLDAKAEQKKALDTFNAQPTRENNGKLRKATEAAKAARNEVIRAAQRHAEILERVPSRGTSRVELRSSEGLPEYGRVEVEVADEDGSNVRHFEASVSTPDVEESNVRQSKVSMSIPYPSIARFFSPKRLGGDFISQNAQDEEGNDLLLKTDESKWAQFINPAKPERAVGQVHPVTTPTPLEQIELETGFTFADAQKVVTDAGLTIPKLDLSVVTPEKIARYYDDGVATFSRVYARLLDQVVSWGGAESLDYATRMRVLVGIDMAKQAARDIVGEYQLSKEIGFLQNPTRGLGITASAVELDQSEKGAAIKAENAKLGYTERANPYELKAGDQVAFAKGNKIVKAVVSYVMPVGPNKAVFLRHLVDVSKVDLDNLTDKQISALDNKMVEDVISASDLSKVTVMRKAAVKGDAEKIGKMFDAYDKVMGAVQRDNWTLEALASVPPETLQGQVAADILENMQSVYDPYENSDEDDFGGNGLYAIMPDIVPSTPVIDPGKFVVRNLDTINPDTTNPITLSDEEFRTLFGDPDAFDAALKAAQDYARDKSKPSFSNVMNDTALSGRNQMYGMTPLKQFDIVDKGLDETKTSKFLYWMGASTGLDRKVAMNIGQKNAQEAFGFIEAASVAQQEKESRMQAMIDNTVEAVFGGKRTAYDRWRIGIKNDSIEATVEGVKQQVSEAEIMSLYAMSKKPEVVDGAPRQFERAAAPFGGVDAANALIEKLSPESKKFVDVIGVGTLAGISQHPEWVPAVEFGQYRGSGWASRKKNKVEYIPAFELVNSDTPLAALDYYDSITKAITKYAMDASGLRTQLENLQMIFEFDKRVDRSKFAPIVPGSADEKLFNEMSRRSKLMRDKLAEKIGARMANAFIKNIEYDLKNPSFLDDVAETPEAKWFGRFSRSSGASVLMLNIKQGLQNLGNYHRLFGLSGSNMFRYYTTDWVKAVAHTREAWALMKQNPELLRRLKQAGLSEHMIRVVDENSDSIFTDIQAEFLKHGRDKASNVTAFLGTVSNMATKWGMAPNVFGDALGLAWGNYAVYDHVRSQVSAANKPTLLKRRDGTDVEAAIDMLTQREIGNYINSHISSSNYMARSMLTKMMNKMGLGALVMFTNDQLQGFGSLAQAISVLQNSKDKVELERAKKDIMGWAVSTVRYIAIKAGWYGALAAMAMGKDLSDDEMDYIWDSTVSEAVMQMGGWHQLSNLGVAPVLRAVIDGDRLGPSIVSVSAAGRGISAARRGDWWDFASEAASMTFFPVANGLSRVVEAANYMMSSNEYEQQVGLKMLGGASKSGAMESLGLSDNNEDKEVKPKKKLKKDGE